MQCASTIECLDHIGAYYSGKKTGHFLFVDVENYDDFQAIANNLRVDDSEKTIYASDYCFPNGLPNINGAIETASKNGKYFLVGISQALMFQNDKNVEKILDELLEHSIPGFCVVLLEHCGNLLRAFLRKDIRRNNRIILVDGETSTLPKIRIVPEESLYKEKVHFTSFQKMLSFFEKMDENQMKTAKEVSVESPISPSAFINAIYSIAGPKDTYEVLKNKYPELLSATFKANGTDEQWTWLSKEISSHKSFSELICAYFGSTSNLVSQLPVLIDTADENMFWLWWLALRVFDDHSNTYLTRIITNTSNAKDFEEHVYMGLLDIPRDSEDFERCYFERKRLLDAFPDNLSLVEEYCKRLGLLQKDEVFYLTEKTKTEKHEFVRCLSIYTYTKEELRKAIHTMSRSLEQYMQRFIFDEINTHVGEDDASLRTALNEYFDMYKMQKLTNHLDPTFLQLVSNYAEARPYNKLLPRSSIVAHMNKDNARVFFFDALGVEYLSFILAKCEEYGLASKLSIGHCELPSITSCNKEFLQYFPDGWYKIDDLDEMKHHSQIYNYEKCSLPIHLFEELEVIDKELKKIQAQLIQGLMEKAIIISDHGASRLAVLYGSEIPSMIELDESGEHSGRCCPIDTNPDIPFAAYENGYAVLANYDRFKGGRRANVEVHGGASLEEMLVPIITLTKRTSEFEACFINTEITIKPHVIPELVLYTTHPLKKPRLYMDGKYYEGVFVEDDRHSKFLLPDIKRKGLYSADLYDGDENLAISLQFSVRKQTREIDLF